MSVIRREGTILSQSKDRDGTRREASDRSLFDPHGGAGASTGLSTSWHLPRDLRLQATRRLRVIALLYALAFFLADFGPPLFLGSIREKFQDPIDWAATAASIVAGLVVAALVASPRLSWETKVNLGLVFEVAASYGIALSQYLGVSVVAAAPIVLHVISPSWVAVWMVFFAVVVPAPPGRALLALIGAASAPPVVIGLALHHAGLSHLMSPSMFFLHHVFTYMICAMLGYVGARVVYALGADVSRARELGSYRLIERLGAGGMGEVWKASHHLLARQAAIKFIRPDAIASSDPQETKTVLKRFELEARATASLSSAHTVAIYDYGVTDDGTFYYVMELLDGMDCDRLIRSFGPLPPARVVHLMAQVCESLEEAHDKHLIHRDVKPANIYVCRSGNRCDFVKVLDFGIVAHPLAPSVPELRLTLPQEAVGTPQFMAPEVALGQKLDGRADLYGLGCVAYWLAAGRPVFEGSSVYDVIAKHLHEPPDPPSLHAPGGMPPELDALILRCLAKEPAQRPADARELARQLRVLPLPDPWSEELAEAWWNDRLASGASPGRGVTGDLTGAPTES